MARQEAKPQGPREAGPAARGRRGRAGGGAARRLGVRGSGPAPVARAAASQDAPPPPLPPLLLGLVLLAALSEHCLADTGKHLAAALRPWRFLEERGRPARRGRHLTGWRWMERSLQHRRWDFLRPLLLPRQENCQKSVSREGTVGRGSNKRCILIFFLDKLQVLPSGPGRHASFR